MSPLCSRVCCGVLASRNPVSFRMPSKLYDATRTTAASFSSSASDKTIEEDDEVLQAKVVTVTKSRPRRRRHQFRNLNADEIPSFHDFQQQVQVRALYRQFTRLVAQKSGGITGQRLELQKQIRREFRLPQQDSWHIKRALSEGNRRYKELSAMLGSSVKENNNAAPASVSQNSSSKETIPHASTSTIWPWNSPDNKEGDRPSKRPSPFPPKSNL